MNIFRTFYFLIFALLAAGCRREAKLEPAPAATVSGDKISFATNAPQLAYLTREPAQERTAAAIGLYGRLAWDDEVTVRIYSPVAGRVLNAGVEVNQAVAAGDALAALDSPDFGQALAEARTAAGNLAAADKTLARARELLAHGAAAQKDVESAEAAFVAAQAEKDRAVARLENYGGTLASTNSIYSLRSPLAGVLVEKNISPGQEIRPDLMLANAPQFISPQFVVTDPKKLWLFLDVDELTVSQLRPGQRVLVHTPAFPDKNFTGQLEVIGRALDPTTRTIKARCRVDNADGRLSAEMYVTVEVTASAAAGVEISSKAIFLKDNQPYVFVEIAPGEFQRRAVKLGLESSGRTAILEGVSADDRVVSDGGLLLESILEGDNS